MEIYGLTKRMNNDYKMIQYDRLFSHEISKLIVFRMEIRLLKIKKQNIR